MGRVAGFISLALVLLFTSGAIVSQAEAQKTWCVAKPSSDSTTLQENIDFACSQVNCSVLQKGNACYNPDNLISHASIAMNLYYQAKGRQNYNCDFKNSALIVQTNPSYGICAYA